jgi:hypothetical protein
MNLNTAWVVKEGNLQVLYVPLFFTLDFYDSY